MEAILEKLSIDKSTWTLVKLGDVVAEPKENAKDLQAEGVDKVVGLEHIDTEDVHLRRFAGLEDSTTFTKKFRKGDILFGRRRAYLKKAAQAPFSGICSGDITVLRAKKGILPELLPFVICNDKFFDYAVKHSAGGLSPRVKFKDLANYEFLLPPKEQQAQLAELLWAMDEVIEKEKTVLERLRIALFSRVENEMHGLTLKGKTISNVIEEISGKNEIIKLEKLGNLLKGKGIPKSEVKDAGIPCVRYGELYTKHNRIIREYHSYISESKKNSSIKLEKDDVLFAGSGETIVEIGKSAAFVDDTEVYVGSDTIVFRPFDMDGYFSGYLMNSILVRQQLNKYGTGATVMHIYNSDIAKIKVPKISRVDQVKIGMKLERISVNILKLERQIIESNVLQKSLINQIF